ncbi:protein DENND6A-like isoform X2 [Homarus americanus]|uniref:protein DENND6A-like isoform X2 n=1 Tax=Homarus americanus TaxID=6706 RepID=UPI001C46160A|nr:protein DENND6A-like isoform X2 [Homarus americanus]
MSPNDEKDTPLLPWDNFSRWVHAICVVTFDLELGQAMEMIYPGDRELTERERTNICYLAFPDSNSGLMGNVQFHFRIRQCPQSIPLHTRPAIHQYNSSCPTNIQTEDGYLYGYVYFRQVKDRTLRRGYFQKSVVLLSHLPLVSLFTTVLDLVAPEYFDMGEASLEAACHHLDQWPPPTPGITLSLPLLGTLVQVRIPSRQDKPGAATLTPPSPPLTSPGPLTVLVPTPHETEAFRVLAPVLPHLNLLWELVLTAEPLVVMAMSPTTAANTVQTLISLITPLKFSGDYRPFFTIHDSEFKEYTTRTSAPPNVILGVTNPFFAKTLQHWPHIIRIGDNTGSPNTQKHKLKKASALKTVEQKPGVYTKYKPHLQADKGLVKRLLKGVQTGRPVEVQSALLRRHLLELTQSFMIPLERYVASLMPLQKNISPYKAIPSLRPFNPDDFLATLELYGPQLTSGIRGDWEGLYRRFFRSVNFSVWFNARHQEVSAKLSELHLQALCNADLGGWVCSRSEVEVVDMVLRLRAKLTTADSLCVDQHTRDKLHDHLQTLFMALPEDLRSVLHAS